MSVSRPLISSFASSTLSPPQTVEEQSYGALGPTITLSSNGISSCSPRGQSNGYSDMSIAQFGSNPFSPLSNLKSPFLQLTSQSAVTSQLSAQPTNQIATTPAYFVSLQFGSRQSLNFSVYSEKPRRSNFTLPQCTQWAGSSFSPCSGCNISSFTDFNVTYACFSLDAFCGPPTIPSSRALRKSAVSVQTADDDASFSSQSSQSASFGAVFVALGGEFTSILSLNPFSFNLQKSKTVLIFVSVLTFSIIAGYFIFVKIDRDERTFMAFSKFELAESKSAHKSVGPISKWNSPRAFEWNWRQMLKAWNPFRGGMKKEEPALTDIFDNKISSAVQEPGLNSIFHTSLFLIEFNIRIVGIKLRK